MPAPHQFTLNRRYRRLGVWAGILGLAIAVTASPCVGVPVPAGRSRSSVGPDQRALTFPRTAAYCLDQHRLPPAGTLARYDLVVIDHEWANRLPRSYFTRMRARNPRLLLLAYVNVVDSMHQLGSRTYWANSYELWQFRTPTESTFPRQWLAHTAAGVPVHEWEDRAMTNLTDRSPRVGGQRFVEYAAHWVVKRVWSAGIWDGVYLDVWGDTIWTADSDRWDIDGDGTDELGTEIYGPGGPLDRGLTIGERIMRERMPDAILIANGSRTLRHGLLDGRVWESFGDPRVGRNAADDAADYISVSASGAHRRPGTAMTISFRRNEPGSSEEYRRARLAVATTLLQNGFWASMNADGEEPLSYDEMDAAGLGRGYLGRPIEANPGLGRLRERRTRGTGSPLKDVYRRDFEHGIVLLNLGDGRREVRLERPYRHINGTQDRSVNDGRLVDRVSLAAQDGVILLDPRNPPLAGSAAPS